MNVRRFPAIIALAAAAAWGQTDWTSPPSTSYTALNTFLGSLGTMQAGAGAPVGTCTAGKITWLDTANTVLYACGASGWYATAVIVGIGAPGSGVGIAGSWYLDGAAACLYGPKTSAWPETCKAMGAPAASSGAPAMDGTAAAGSSASYARADHIHPTDTSRQAAITTGTTSQYLRGDLSLATFPTTWAWGSLTGVPTLTNTVFGRSGTVTAASGDYTTAQVTESGNLYFTNARAVTAMSGLYQTPITTGTTSQYLRGDLSLATFPTIPNSFDMPAFVICNTLGCGSEVSVNAYFVTSPTGITFDECGVSMVGLPTGTDVHIDVQYNNGQANPNNMWISIFGATQLVVPVSNTTVGVTQFQTTFANAPETLPKGAWLRAVVSQNDIAATAQFGYVRCRVH